MAVRTNNVTLFNFLQLVYCVSHRNSNVDGPNPVLILIVVVVLTLGCFLSLTVLVWHMTLPGFEPGFPP